MVIGAGEQREGLYYFKHATVAATTTTINTPKSLTLWHQRLGHASFQVVEKIPNLCYDKQNNSCTQTCDVCLRAKQTRDVFPISNNKAMQNFQLIHCDVWGPYRTLAMCGARYFLTIVDDHSRAVWVYLLNDKKEVSVRLRQFLIMVERQFDVCVKTVRSDNGTEFMCLGPYFREQGILHETSCPGTPQQNGRVERKHRHILNVARAL
jgi:hypothetical protein